VGWKVEKLQGQRAPHVWPRFREKCRAFARFHAAAHVMRTITREDLPKGLDSFTISHAGSTILHDDARIERRARTIVQIRALVVQNREEIVSMRDARARNRMLIVRHRAKSCICAAF
jgi:hypothetical protein